MWCVRAPATTRRPRRRRKAGGTAPPPRPDGSGKVQEAAETDSVRELVTEPAVEAQQSATRRNIAYRLLWWAPRGVALTRHDQGDEVAGAAAPGEQANGLQPDERNGALVGPSETKSPPTPSPQNPDRTAKQHHQWQMFWWGHGSPPASPKWEIAIKGTPTRHGSDRSCGCRNRRGHHATDPVCFNAAIILSISRHHAATGTSPTPKAKAAGGCALGERSTQFSPGIFLRR